MNTIAKVAFFLLLFTTPHISRASLESAESSFHYQKASNLCHAYTSSEVLSIALTSVEVTAQNLYKGAKTAITMSGFGLTQGTKDFISSREYNEALTECFGPFTENRLKWDSLTLMIILSDSAGQALGYVGSYLVTSKVFSVLSNLSKLSQLKYLEVYFQKNPQALKYIARAGTALVTFGTLKMGYDGFSQSRMLFDPNYAKAQNKKDIEKEKIPALDKDYGELLSQIEDNIQAERMKPATGETKKKIAELVNLYSRTKAKLERHKGDLMVLSQQ